MSMLKNPLEGWGNDDLLLTPQARITAQAADPVAFPVFDWPELREEFLRHEMLAKAAKRRSRQPGVLAALLGGGGATAVPLLSLIPDRTGSILIAVAAGISVIGFALGLFHLISHRFGGAWLNHRMFAERLRHFYFQFLLSNFDLALKALDSEEGLERLRDARRKELASAVTALKDEAATRWDLLSKDRDHERTWVTLGIPQNLYPVQQACIRAAEANPEGSQRLLNRLYDQRVLVQTRFTAQALLKTLASSAGWAAISGFMTKSAIVLVPVLTGIGGWLHAIGETGAAGLALALASAAAASGLTLKVLDQGLRFTSDEERYQRYQDSLASVYEQYTHPDADSQDRLRSLFDLERHAYWETREFFNGHSGDNFGYS